MHKTSQCIPDITSGFWIPAIFHNYQLVWPWKGIWDVQKQAKGFPSTLDEP